MPIRAPRMDRYRWLSLDENYAKKGVVLRWRSRLGHGRLWTSAWRWWCDVDRSPPGRRTRASRRWAAVILFMSGDSLRSRSASPALGFRSYGKCSVCILRFHNTSSSRLERRCWTWRVLRKSSGSRYSRV